MTPTAELRRLLAEAKADKQNKILQSYSLHATAAELKLAEAAVLLVMPTPPTTAPLVKLMVSIVLVTVAGAKAGSARLVALVTRPLASQNT